MITAKEAYDKAEKKINEANGYEVITVTPKRGEGKTETKISWGKII